MQLAIVAAVGVAAVMALEVQPISRADTPLAASPAVATVRDSTLSSRVAGTWIGSRKAKSPRMEQQFRLVWHRARNGNLTGTIKPSGMAGHPITAVWSSDTALIAESAPYMSHRLHERVVTRSVIRLNHGTLVGTFETRPTHYSGRTVRGTFTANRMS